MTDPIAAMLTTLRNAIAVHKDVVVMPHSKLRESIGKLLQAEGYVGSVKVIPSEVNEKFSELEIGLRYTPNGDAVIQGIRRVSHPGQRIYSPAKKLRKVLGGVGISVVSTPAGLMTDKDARDKGLGGEILFKVW